MHMSKKRKEAQKPDQILIPLTCIIIIIIIIYYYYYYYY